MEGVASEAVDNAISTVLDLAVEHTLQEKCSAAEAATIRRALVFPTAEIAELQIEAEALVVEALEMAVPALLNAALFPED